MGFVCLLFIPWNSHVHIPGILTSATYASIYSPESAQITSIAIKRGQKVEREEVLMVLNSSKLDKEIELTRKQLEIYNLRAMRAVANRQDQDDLPVIFEQIAAESSKLEGLERRQEKLIMRAPFSGVVVEVNDTINVNQSVSNMTPLYFIVDPSATEIKGIANVNEINRIEFGQQALFYPDDFFLPKLTATINRIDWGDIKSLGVIYLASEYGGSVAVKEHENGKFVPASTVYDIRLNNVSSAVPQQEIRGTIFILGQPRSLAKRAYELAVSVIIRESGF